MKVVCIKEGNWINVTPYLPDLDNKSPIKDHIYTVLEVVEEYDGLYYELKGFRELYFAKEFVPLDDYLEQFTESLTKELIEVKQLELI